MRSTKSPGLLGLVVLLSLCAFSVVAQERQEFPNEDNRNTYELSPGLELHINNKGGEAHRDTVTIKQPIGLVKPKAAEASKAKTQDEPLSFNFLYYIIQKFKGSDVVD